MCQPQGISRKIICLIPWPVTGVVLSPFLPHSALLGPYPQPSHFNNCTPHKKPISMVTVEMAGRTGFRIHFEGRGDRVCWAHGGCTICVCWVNGYTEYSGLRQDFFLDWMNYSCHWQPPSPALFSFHAHLQLVVWWLTLCSTSPDSREGCPEHWTLGYCHWKIATALT